MRSENGGTTRALTVGLGGFNLVLWLVRTRERAPGHESAGCFAQCLCADECCIQESVACVRKAVLQRRGTGPLADPGPDQSAASAAPHAANSQIQLSL